MFGVDTCWWNGDAGLYAEVQQRLVDRTSGEGGLWGGLHPQPGQTGEHPPAAGAEDETEPTQLQVAIKKDKKKPLYTISITTNDPTFIKQVRPESHFTHQAM